MLVVVIKTANRHIVLVAFALADEETLDSWTFFLKNLAEHVKGDLFVCLILDCHQGIIGAFRDLEEWSDMDEMSETERSVHTFCLRHLKTNLGGKIRNEIAKHLCWDMGEQLKMHKYSETH